MTADFGVKRGHTADGQEPPSPPAPPAPPHPDILDITPADLVPRAVRTHMNVTLYPKEWVRCHIHWFRGDARSIAER